MLLSAELVFSGNGKFSELAGIFKIATKFCPQCEDSETGVKSFGNFFFTFFDFLRDVCHIAYKAY